MFRVLDIYIIQDFSLWFYYFLGVAFNFTMNLGLNMSKKVLTYQPELYLGWVNAINF